MRRTNDMKVWMILLATLVFTFYLAAIVMSVPEGPSVITGIANKTKTPTSGGQLNTSGGIISVINLNASTQNLRWKAYVGNVSGTLTLSDAASNAIYNWVVTQNNGEVYATRSSGTPLWTNVSCANRTIMETENLALGQTSPDDNITRTFNGTTHNAFYVGINRILANACPTTNTYINGTAQDSSFEEIVIYDGTTVLFATNLEQHVAGYDLSKYDFQIILPENGTVGFSSFTPYYFYVELL